VLLAEAQALEASGLAGMDPAGVRARAVAAAEELLPREPGRAQLIRRRLDGG
jgi:hypothetical protein